MINDPDPDLDLAGPEYTSRSMASEYSSSSVEVALQFQVFARDGAGGAVVERRRRGQWYCCAKFLRVFVLELYVFVVSAAHGPSANSAKFPETEGTPKHHMLTSFPSTKERTTRRRRRLRRRHRQQRRHGRPTNLSPSGRP
jgi:hypothetical protein